MHSSEYTCIITDSVVLWKIQKFDWLISEAKWHSCLHNRTLCSYLATLRLLRQRENNPQFSGTYLYRKVGNYKFWMLRALMYRDASHLWRSFSHNRTKINIQFLNNHYSPDHIQKYKPSRTKQSFYLHGRRLRQQLHRRKRNVNTRKKTLSNIKLVQSYLLSISASNQLHSLVTAELNRHLANFLVVVRQKDESDYQPSYFHGIQSKGIFADINMVEA